MNPDLIKAVLILAAYQGAEATIGELDTVDNTQVKADSMVQDLGLQKKNVLVYEEAKIHYAAIVRAFQDKTGIWPDPKLSADGVSVGVQAGGVNVLVNALKGIPSTSPAAAIASVLLNALGGAVGGTSATPVPAPGADLAGAAK